MVSSPTRSRWTWVRTDRSPDQVGTDGDTEGYRASGPAAHSSPSWDRVDRVTRPPELLRRPRSTLGRTRMPRVTVPECSRTRSKPSPIRRACTATSSSVSRRYRWQRASRRHDSSYSISTAQRSRCRQTRRRAISMPVRIRSNPKVGSASTIETTTGRSSTRTSRVNRSVARCPTTCSMSIATSSEG